MGLERERLIMIGDVADVSMPEGIEVDEAAAYFGVFESSDSLHQMMEMPREAAFEKFFSLLSDLVLKPGDFDFELASERLNCEGGEIYFLVAGHLGVMSLPEELALALSEGTFTDAESQRLQEIADPMRLLKLFAIAQQTGGEGEATKYLRGVESLMSNPAANKDALLSLASEVQAAFDVAGHVTPIASLASGDAVASAVETAYVPPAPVQTEAVTEEIAVPEEVVIEPVSVPLPTQASTPLPEPNPDPVPLPEVEAPVVQVDDRKESEKTADAFAGAFGMIEPDPEPEVVPEPEPEPEAAPEPEQELEPEPESNLDDAFAAADTDHSGGLSVQEVADATGLGLEEAEKLHSEADIDGDGEVTLEELKSNPEVIEKMALPKPVKPIRAGIQKPQIQQPTQQEQTWQQQQQQQQQQAWQQQQQQQQQQQAWQQQQQQQQQQQAWQQQQQQQQQQQAWQQQQQQPMQPTIRSGLHCRGCRIGVDPNWR
ncbi:MAG: hypothetical protein ACJZ2K_01480, partial [Candidatus Poseidoniaceae archaeon]